ncbi:hypothetical protein [Hyalangium versicolor]|uniref:hypothetical protein n=1 Tax=Hyalangium versicolor TaxID=2861190 RepID=UPI001CCA1B03|nr:hypothetical protein [Hyalangium versicolor]
MNTVPDTRPAREMLPPGLFRELPGMSATLPPAPAEPPSSIRAAIVRWLNEEL